MNENPRMPPSDFPPVPPRHTANLLGQIDTLEPPKGPRMNTYMPERCCDCFAGTRGFFADYCCEQKIQRPNNFAGVTYPGFGNCPGHVSRDSFTAVVAPPFAREKSFGFETKSWDLLFGSVFGVTINPWLKNG